MPTGYTAPIYEGQDITFAQFAMRCARGFMPLISMREEPPDAVVPDEIAPDPWYARAEEEAAQFLAAAEARTEAEWDALAASDHAAATREAEAANAQARARIARYQAMLSQVEAWQPPTPDHGPLKELMRQQLTREAEDDAYERTAPDALTGAEYREQALDFGRRDLERRRKATAEEAERARYATGWVRALRASLTDPETAESAEASD